MVSVAPVPNDPLAKDASKEILRWTSVPMIDIRVTDTQIRLRNAIEPVSSDRSAVTDLTLKISGLIVKSHPDGVVSVSAAQEEGIIPKGRIFF